MNVTAEHKVGHNTTNTLQSLIRHHFILWHFFFPEPGIQTDCEMEHISTVSRLLNLIKAIFGWNHVASYYHICWNHLSAHTNVSFLAGGKKQWRAETFCNVLVEDHHKSRDGMAFLLKTFFLTSVNWKGLFSIFLYARDNDHEMELFDNQNIEYVTFIYVQSWICIIILVWEGSDCCFFNLYLSRIKSLDNLKV